MIKLGSRAFSSPEIASPSSHSQGALSDHEMAFEGVAANVKLLLKLIHEQSHANNLEVHDDRRARRVAGMMTILDDVKARIERYSTPPVNKGGLKKEFRRCNTDLRPHRVPRSTSDNNKKSATDQDIVVIDEKDKLRRSELHAKKSLEAMCSSLGKDREIMAMELSRKVHELHGLEELINDLRAQNQTLLAKLQACAANHNNNQDTTTTTTTTTTTNNNNNKEKKKQQGQGQGQGQGGDQNQNQTHQGMVYAALQDRNKALSEQLLKSLDGYRSLKRKYQDAKEENQGLQTTMEEIGVEVEAGLGRIHGLKQHLATRTQKADDDDDIEEEISALESMFQSLNIKVSKHMQKKTTAN